MSEAICTILDDLKTAYREDRFQTLPFGDTHVPLQFYRLEDTKLAASLILWSMNSAICRDIQIERMVVYKVDDAAFMLIGQIVDDLPRVTLGVLNDKGVGIEIGSLKELTGNDHLAITLNYQQAPGGHVEIRLLPNDEMLPKEASEMRDALLYILKKRGFL